MYFFVPYNLSPIQQAIQAGHAGMQYVYTHGFRPELISFMDNDKTWIVLNGGTTRTDPNDPGTMQILLNEIFVFNEQHPDNSVNKCVFHEPDINNALTAICFLADERVWDYENYPDFVDFIMNVKMYAQAKAATPVENYIMLKAQSIEHLQEIFPEYYEDWVAFLGGEKNLFLRNLIKNKKLA
jgi:hypothetical protein